MIYRNVKTNVLHWDFVSPLSPNLLRKLKRAKEHSPAVHLFPCHRCSVRDFFKQSELLLTRVALEPRAA